MFYPNSNPIMKAISSIFIFLILTFSCIAKNSPKESFHIFLLMGQSNMAGYGEILPEDKSPIEGVVMLRNSITEKDKQFCWVAAKQPIHNRLPSDQFCLAGPFAQAYHTMYPASTVGLIPMAWGGAAISQMEKGSTFYEEIIRKATWAKQQGHLKAILWHQGESDTVSPETAEQYYQKLEKLIHDLRFDLNEPDLPVIIGDLAEFYGTGKEHNAPERINRINLIRKSLKDISQKIPNTEFVSTTGLVSHDQHQVHFNRQSYIILGYRYFDVYWNHYSDKQ